MILCSTFNCSQPNLCLTLQNILCHVIYAPRTYFSRTHAKTNVNRKQKWSKNIKFYSFDANVCVYFMKHLIFIHLSRKWWCLKYTSNGKSVRSHNLNIVNAHKAHTHTHPSRYSKNTYASKIKNGSSVFHSSWGKTFPASCRAIGEASICSHSAYTILTIIRIWILCGFLCSLC